VDMYASILYVHMGMFFVLIFLCILLCCVGTVYLCVVYSKAKDKFPLEDN